MSQIYEASIGKQSYSLYLIHVPVVMVIVFLYRGKVPILACPGIVIDPAIRGGRGSSTPEVILCKSIAYGVP
jgi:hypothetical protein